MQQAHLVGRHVQLELSNHSSFQRSHGGHITHLHVRVVGTGPPRKDVQAAGAPAKALGHKGSQQRQGQRRAQGKAREEAGETA